MKTIFLSKNDYIDKCRLYVDGSSISNSGQSAIGIIIYDQNWKEIDRCNEIIGSATCNQAEYKALIKGLDLAAIHTRKKVFCFLDSDLVEGQITGRYRLKDENLRLLFHKVKDYERAFEEVIYNKVRENDHRLKIAHKIAHDALNGR